ncbi:anaphase-promoting complex subunit 5 [Pontibacter ummariensis]|uniref:histidine kinase n=1 Tax=Pontibacter ummariensis TaxID=1610492 RepID=A0A239HZD3_9BACT|nr:tetratricopeptide repeat protein [Pontibacter ummariensis]PRY10111.1 anaphase-promoting complex subunit 5 [Pontibacter ummariensis]SNS86083.1 Anaphase-promoting complex subunit 5 [Pontibacter ummariensis]
MSAINERIKLLEEQLQTAKDTVTCIDLLNRVAYELRHTDTALSLLKSKQAIQLAETISYEKGLASGLLNQGFVEMVLANYSTAFQVLFKAAQIFETLQDAEGRAHALYNLGLVYRGVGDYNQALESCQESITVRRSLGDKEGEAACLMQLGYINMQFGNLEEAEKHYEKSISLRRELHDQAGIAAVLVGLALVKQKRRQYGEAEGDLLESLAMREELGETHGWLVAMNYLGDFYLEQDKLSKAEQYLSDALQKAKQCNKAFPANFCRLCTSLSKVHLHYKNYGEAVDLLEEALRTAKEAHLRYLIYDIYLALSAVYKQQGDYQQALIYHEKYHQSKEEVINFSASTKLKNMELANQIEAQKREAEIHRLRNIELKKAYDQLKKTQMQLIQSEKMASLGELTAGIAHEIRNPLNFVNNFSEVCQELVEELREEQQKRKRDDALEEEIIRGLQENLAKIHEHGSRAESIVNGMLEHSRASCGEKRPIDLNALAGEYLRLAYHGLRAKDKSFNAKLVTQFDELLAPVEVVPQEIGRVLLNLYNNAFYATQQKLKQEGQGYQPEVCVSTRQRGGKTEIKIRDNGAGIPKAVRGKIFQPFFTTKPSGQGTGLGLSLSYDIITKGHGGTLSVDSVEGEFTEFTLQLP